MNATEFLLAIQAAKRADITSLNQLAVLVHLSTKDDGDYPSRIADIVGCSSSAITGSLDILENLGLIERVKDEPKGSDRRAKRVRITEKGRETVGRMMAQNDQVKPCH